MTSVTDRDGRQITYSYDSAGNRTGETWVNGSYTATYTYDAANRLTVEQDTFSKYTLGYDNGNRLTSVDNSGTPNAPHLVLTYTLDHFGNVTGVNDNLSGGVSDSYDLDNRLFLAQLTVPIQHGSNGPRVTLTYDNASRLTTIVRGQITLTSATITTTLSYDNANRLTNITHTSSSAGTLMTLTYGYDAANQLTSYSGPEGTLTYTYDNDGQLTNVGDARTETYTYDKEGNRTMTGYTTTIGNRLTADGTYTYSYDNDGNMVGRTRTSDSQVTSFTYDYRNRLTEVLIKTSTGTTVQDDKFTYDVENRRIGRNTLSGGQSWTGYDGVNPYADFNSSGSLTYRYLYGNDIDFLLARADTSGTPLWYLADKLGSVREDVSTSGTVLDSITYDSYGNILTESNSSNGDRFKFTSREWDSEIGQYFYRARYYLPSIGRFESEDTIGFSARDANLFRYVFNKPISHIDGTGNDGGPGVNQGHLSCIIGFMLQNPTEPLVWDPGMAAFGPWFASLAALSCTRSILGKKVIPPDWRDWFKKYTDCLDRRNHVWSIAAVAKIPLLFLRAGEIEAGAGAGEFPWTWAKFSEQMETFTVLGKIGYGLKVFGTPIALVDGAFSIYSLGYCGWAAE